MGRSTSPPAICRAITASAPTLSPDIRGTGKCATPSTGTATPSPASAPTGSTGRELSHCQPPVNGETYSSDLSSEEIYERDRETRVVVLRKPEAGRGAPYAEFHQAWKAVVERGHGPVQHGRTPRRRSGGNG